ncbi:MAG: hypothetical protein LBG83_07965 [Oscillospiraceae bacterium]|jgi:hypothetical protein|nr:hypothetical protein [Oscillospiraceae bacterium]
MSRQNPAPPEDEFQPLAVLRLHWRKIFFICAGAIFLLWGVAVIGDAVVSRAGRWVTVRAEYVEQKIALAVEVTFVREETLLRQDTNGVVVPLVQAGQRVAAGQAYAAVCADTRDAEALSRQRALEQRVSWLREASEAHQYHALNAERLGAQVDEAFSGFLADLERGDYEGMTDWQEVFLHRATTLEAALGRPVDLTKEIAAAEEQLAGLRAQAAPERFSQRRAHESGCYYPVSDGMEEILTPQALLEDVVPESFSALLERGAQSQADAAGKLVTGFNWYAVALLGANEAQKLREGAAYSVAFPQESARVFPMKLERLRWGENGQAIAVLSCNEKDDVLQCLRTARAEIIQNTVDGLSIPSAALRFRETGEGAQRRRATGVYIVRAGRALWREVEVLYQDRKVSVVAWGRQSEAQAVPGDTVTISGTIQSLTRPDENKAAVVGRDLSLVAENTHVIPAIEGGPTSAVTARRGLFDETVFSGKNLTARQEDGKLILTGEDITYREQRGTGLKIFDAVLV